MLMADEKGASVIVAVGTHGTLEEFLDKGRAGMSSTFLTRLRVGSKLVDAKGVSRLYRQRISTFQLALLALAGLAALRWPSGPPREGRPWSRSWVPVWMGCCPGSPRCSHPGPAG